MKLEPTWFRKSLQFGGLFLVSGVINNVSVNTQKGYYHRFLAMPYVVM